MSTAAGSSLNNRDGQFNIMGSFDNSKYKISVMDMVNSSKKNSTDEFGQSAFGEPRV